MIELPELVIWLIADHLNYEDVRNLRVTCKRLKAIIDQKVFRSLHLLVREFPFERDLFQTDELVDYPNTFRVERLGILSSTKFKSQFSGLVKFTIDFTILGSIEHLEKVNLNDLNHFVQLVHLEILGLDLENGELSLPNLKIASFVNQKFDSPDFELACPQLNALCLAKGTLPKLTRETSSSIRHLSLNVPCVRVLEPSYRSYELGLYEQLTNLTTVSFRDSEHAERFVRDLIEGRVCLPSLKQIKLKEAGDYSDRSFESFILLKSRKETRHIEFRVNWKVMDLDALVEMRDLIRHINPKSPSKICVDLFTSRTMDRKTLRHLAEIPSFDCLLPDDSCIFFEYIEDAPFIRQLIDKLVNLLDFQIGKEVVLDEGLFESLLKKSRRIRYLHIESDRLTQQQLDRMPDYLTSLRYLEFRPDFQLDDINLDFVAKFNLSRIGFRFNIEKERMSSLFKLFKCNPSFELAIYGAQSVCMPVQPNENGRFEIICELETIILHKEDDVTVRNEFASLEDAIDSYYENDLFNNRLQQLQ